MTYTPYECEQNNNELRGRWVVMGCPNIRPCDRTPCNIEVDETTFILPDIQPNQMLFVRVFKLSSHFRA